MQPLGGPHRLGYRLSQFGRFFLYINFPWAHGWHIQLRMGYKQQLNTPYIISCFLSDITLTLLAITFFFLLSVSWRFESGIVFSLRIFKSIHVNIILRDRYLWPTGMHRQDYCQRSYRHALDDCIENAGKRLVGDDRADGLCLSHIYFTHCQLLPATPTSTQITGLVKHSLQGHSLYIHFLKQGGVEGDDRLENLHLVQAPRRSGENHRKTYLNFLKSKIEFLCYYLGGRSYPTVSLFLWKYGKMDQLMRGSLPFPLHCGRWTVPWLTRCPRECWISPEYHDYPWPRFDSPILFSLRWKGYLIYKACCEKLLEGNFSPRALMPNVPFLGFVWDGSVGL